MFKKITRGVIFVASILCLNLNVFAVDTFKKTVFLWDLHDVILKKDWSALAKISWKNLWSTRILGKLQRPLVRKIFNMIHTKSKGADVSVEEFIWVAQQYNHTPLIQMMRDLQNAQKINPGMLSIIKDLHAQGFTHHIGSNIGESCFKELVDYVRYPQFKELFGYFDLTFPQVVCFNAQVAHEVIKKPYSSFFMNYLKNNKIDFVTTRVIFVDDRLENVIAARKLNFTAIHFKNPKQLVDELKILGIFIQ